MALPIVYHPDYVTPLPPEHRFPMPKFGMIYHLLLRDGLITPEQVHQPVIASPHLLEQVHTADYIQAFSQGRLDAKAQRRIGLPWSEKIWSNARVPLWGGRC